MSDLYKIGAAAQQTGISTERLRIWERRYGMQPAERAGTTRFYSKDQIRKLKLINQLIGHGDSISHIIGLDESALRERLSPQPPVPQFDRPGPLPVVDLSSKSLLMVGPGLSLMLQGAAGVGSEAFKSVCSIESTELLNRHADLIDQADVVVLELPSLDVSLIQKLDELQHRPLVVVYRNSHVQDREDAESSGMIALRWPANWNAIEAASMKAMQVVAAAALSRERQYSDRELVRIAALAEQELDCDCLQNFVRTLAELNALETHLARCSGEHAHEVALTRVQDSRAPLEVAVQTFLREHRLLEKVGLTELAEPV